MSGVHVRVRVGAEAYALPVANVVEVGVLGEVATVPGSPAAVLGVRNLRGNVLPVFRLETLLGSGSAERPQLLVVTEEGGRLAGLAVDEVTDVGPLPDLLQETESDFLTGATLQDGALVGVIDVPRLFRKLEGARDE